MSSSAGEGHLIAHIAESDIFHGFFYGAAAVFAGINYAPVDAPFQHIFKEIRCMGGICEIALYIIYISVYGYKFLVGYTQLLCE